MKVVHHCEKAEDYEALLPWNIDLVKVTTNGEFCGTKGCFALSAFITRFN